MKKISWFHYAAPHTFYGLAGKAWPWFAALATVLMLAGMWLGFAVAPTDFQQGEGYRIIFVHVPASWMLSLIHI
jgi:heme exporter protein C